MDKYRKRHDLQLSLSLDLLKHIILRLGSSRHGSQSPNFLENIIPSSCPSRYGIQNLDLIKHIILSLDPSWYGIKCLYLLRYIIICLGPLGMIFYQCPNLFDPNLSRHVSLNVLEPLSLI